MWLPSPWVLNPPREEWGRSDQASAPAPAKGHAVASSQRQRGSHTSVRIRGITSGVVDGLEEAGVVVRPGEEAKLAGDEAAGAKDGSARQDRARPRRAERTYTLPCFLASSQSFLALEMSPDP